MEVESKVGSIVEAKWKHSGSKLEASWQKWIQRRYILGYKCLLTKEVPHEEYKRGPVSMKDQDCGLLTP